MDAIPIEHEALLKLCLSAYVGETCQGCGKTFDNIDQVKESVWWPHDGGRLGHPKCFAAAHPTHALRN